MKKFIKRNFLLVICVIYWVLYFLYKFVLSKRLLTSLKLGWFIKLFSIFDKTFLIMLIFTAVVLYLFVMKTNTKRAISAAIADNRDKLHKENYKPMQISTDTSKGSPVENDVTDLRDMNGF